MTKTLIVLGWVGNDPTTPNYKRPLAATWSEFSPTEIERALNYAKANGMTVFNREDTPDVLDRVRKEVRDNMMPAARPYSKELTFI